MNKEIVRLTPPDPTRAPRRRKADEVDEDKDYLVD
jgi:hypothetical protein